LRKATEPRGEAPRQSSLKNAEVLLCGDAGNRTRVQKVGENEFTDVVGLVFLEEKHRDRQNCFSSIPNQFQSTVRTSVNLSRSL